MLYKLKGYSDDWIEKRMRGIVIREELTDEWQKRGAQENEIIRFSQQKFPKPHSTLPQSIQKDKRVKAGKSARSHGRFRTDFTMLESDLPERFI